MDGGDARVYIPYSVHAWGARLHVRWPLGPHPSMVAGGERALGRLERRPGERGHVHADAARDARVLARVPARQEGARVELKVPACTHAVHMPYT